MSPMHTTSPICVVASDSERRSSLRQLISDAGYSSVDYGSVEEFFGAFANGKKFALLLLPVSKSLNWRFLEKICSMASIPAIFLVEKDQWQEFSEEPCFSSQLDAITAAEHAYGELIWRIKFLLSKTAQREPPPFEPSEFVFGNYRFIEGLDTVVMHKGRKIRLQRRQFLFALTLFRNVERLMSRDRLLQAWGIDPQINVGSRSIDVCASNIRRKLDLEENGFVLRAVYGRGYLLSSVPLKDIAEHS